MPHGALLARAQRELERLQTTLVVRSTAEAATVRAPAIAAPRVEPITNQFAKRLQPVPDTATARAP